MKANFPRYLHMISDERIGDPPLIFDPDEFDFRAWMMSVFGSQFEAEKQAIEIRASEEEWDDDELKHQIEALEYDWFSVEKYRGQTLERVMGKPYGNVYIDEDGNEYCVFDNDIDADESGFYTYSASVIRRES